MVPVEISTYGAQVDRRLRLVLGDRLVGSWFVGSVAFGAFVPASSDVDIVAVVEGAPTEAERDQVVASVSHPALPCPARGLELVLHRRDVVGSSALGRPFELNLNTGPGLEPRVDAVEHALPGFWFVIDRAVAHRHGVTISGPAASEVFVDPARTEVLDALLDSVRWHRAVVGADRAAVLNAARAWRYADTGVLGPKQQGAEWARSRTLHSEVVAAAEGLDREAALGSQRHEIDGFLDEAEAALRGALG